MEGREVELKAQRDENSQLLQDSLQQSTYTVAVNDFGGASLHSSNNQVF